MDILKQASETAEKAWKEQGLDEASHYKSSVLEGGNLANALNDEVDADRKEFFDEILETVMPVNDGGWTVAAVYEYETANNTDTFVTVIWRIRSSNITKTLIEFKAYLMQWDEENDQYIVAKSRKL